MANCSESERRKKRYYPDDIRGLQKNRLKYISKTIKPGLVGAIEARSYYTRRVEIPKTNFKIK